MQGAELELKIQHLTAAGRSRWNMTLTWLGGLAKGQSWSQKKGPWSTSWAPWLFYFYRHLHFHKAGVPEFLLEFDLQTPETSCLEPSQHPAQHPHQHTHRPTVNRGDSPVKALQARIRGPRAKRQGGNRKGKQQRQEPLFTQKTQPVRHFTSFTDPTPTVWGRDFYFLF